MDKITKGRGLACDMTVALWSTAQLPNKIPLSLYLQQGKKSDFSYVWLGNLGDILPSCLNWYPQFFPDEETKAQGDPEHYQRQCWASQSWELGLWTGRESQLLRAEPGPVGGSRAQEERRFLVTGSQVYRCDFSQRFFS